MSIYQIFRPLIFKLDPEVAHNLAIKFLKFFPNSAGLFCLKRDYKNLHQTLWSLDFANPIGMAAGFDKNAETIDALKNFGFGLIEVGTVTPKAQSGNDRPRMFRLPYDRAVINRLGFNNFGCEVFEKNFEHALTKNFASNFTPIGINIGKNKDSEDAISDYVFLLQKFYAKACYITLNISSPNTKNLRDLQKENQLDDFLSEIMKQKNQLKNLHKKNTPILLKVAPDLTLDEQKTIAEIALKNQIDGLIVSNTTIARESLRSADASESGGLSGAPLFSKSNEVLKNFYKFTGGKIPLIGVGGIFSASDAYQKIRCGASLVQIYSAFVYQGFALVEQIKKDLSLLLEKDGFSNVSQAVGVDVNKV